METGTGKVVDSGEARLIALGEPLPLNRACVHVTSATAGQEDRQCQS